MKQHLNNWDLLYTRNEKAKRRHLRRYIFHIFKICLLKLHKKVLGWRVHGRHKLLSGLSSNARFHVQVHNTNYTKQRSIDTMTPNKLYLSITKYFVADLVLADIDSLCGRYDYFAVPNIVLLWPIWFVASMVAPHYKQSLTLTLTPTLSLTISQGLGQFVFRFWAKICRHSRGSCKLNTRSMKKLALLTNISLYFKNSTMQIGTRIRSVEMVPLQ